MGTTRWPPKRNIEHVDLVFMEVNPCIRFIMLLVVQETLVVITLQIVHSAFPHRIDPDPVTHLWSARIYS